MCVCVSNSVWLEAQTGLLIHSCKCNYLSDRINLIFKMEIKYELNSEITFDKNGSWPNHDARSSMALVCIKCMSSHTKD